MAERPRDRTTIIVGCITITVMVLIAVIFLLVASPWKDRSRHKPAQHAVSRHPVVGTAGA